MQSHFFLLLAFSTPAAAQVADTIAHAPRANVIGIVYDSLDRTPLAGAIVQLVPAEGSGHPASTSLSDSLGSFTFRDIPEGRYRIGFFHTILDSLGFEAPLREVDVVGHGAMRVDLAIPSPSGLRVAICGTPSAPNSGAVVFGFVRDPTTQTPLTDVAVTGEWVELSFGPKGITRRIAHLVATTHENGWFAICNLPSAGTIGLLANRGADSTDRVELEVPADSLLHVDLYLGSSPTASAEPAVRGDSKVPSRLPAHSEEGRLSGVVLTAVGGKPLAGAEVRVSGGQATRTNEHGEWTLVRVALGTRTFEVRAVGYYPERRRVDVVVDAPPIRTGLSTLKAVLDTIRVSATRSPDLNETGFLQRRRSSGTGHFLTAAEIAKRQPVVTSDALVTVPGITIERGVVGPGVLKMRGTFEDKCVPAIYINGGYMPDSTTENIDDLVHPNEVAGIEVYSGAGSPPQFQRALSGCGSIVIWTKRPTR